MKIRLSLLLGALFLISLLAGITSSVWAGQIPSHVYTALKMRDYLSPECQKIVDENPTAYLAGAQGPDIIGVVLSRISLVITVGTESHYERTGTLALKILTTAKTDAEKAFALGWITHYLNDRYVHPVVNRFGGYYSKDEAHEKYHKVLEQLENKYVFMAHGKIVNGENTAIDPSSLGSDFAGFVMEAYGKAFPTKKNYDLELHPEYKAYFAAGFQQAAYFCLLAGRDFWQAYIDGTGTHSYIMQKFPEFPAMPSEAQFTTLIEPLIVNVAQADSMKLKVDVKSQDTKLFRRFLWEWEGSVKQALGRASTILPKVCAYLDAPQKKKSDVEAVLWKEKFLPNVNLDAPEESEELLAPEANLKEFYYDYVLRLNPGTSGEKIKKGANILVKFDTLEYKPKLCFDGNKIGTASFELPTGSFSYQYSITVKLIKDAETEDVDKKTVYGKLDAVKKISVPMWPAGAYTLRTSSFDACGRQIAMGDWDVDIDGSGGVKMRYGRNVSNVSLTGSGTVLPNPAAKGGLGSFSNYIWDVHFNYSYKDVYDQAGGDYRVVGTFNGMKLSGTVTCGTSTAQFSNVSAMLVGRK